MAERSITESDVMAAVRNPHTTYPGKTPNTTCILGSTDAGRSLKVVLIEKATIAIVKTCAWKDEDDG